MAEGQRWWEFYLVRYLAGNIFAVLVLFYLIWFHGTGIQNSLCDGISDNSTIYLCKKIFNKYTKPFSSEVFSFIFITSKEITPKDENNEVTQKLCLPEKCANSQTNQENKSIQTATSNESGFITNKSSKIDITEINFANIFVVAVLGFLYMYISSIPIYVLHIFRGIFLDNTKKGKIWFLFIFYGLVAISLFLKSLPLFIFPVILIISFCLSDRAFKYLKDSTKKRDEIKFTKGRINNFTPEYITSYKHDREHGNAFGIILMEILFAWYLIALDFSILGLISWLLLGFSGWFLGIYLEYKMVYHSEP